MGRSDFNLKNTFGYQPLGDGNFVLVDLYDPNCKVRTVDASFENIACINVPGAVWAPTVDDDGHIFVADSNASEVYKFDKDGNLLLTIGGYGVGDGQFDFPYGISLDSAGNIFVADRLNSRIQKFAPDGTFLMKFGSFGSGNGQFNTPLSVAITPGGDILVADSNNNRIQKFSSTGVYVGTIGTSQMFGGELLMPSVIRVDQASGDIYVTDPPNQKILKYDSSGALLWQTLGFPFHSAGDIGLIGGELAVADTFRIAYYSTNGVFLREKKPVSTSLLAVNDLAIGPENHDFYVVENTEIKQFKYDGQLVRAFGTFTTLNEITTDEDGNVYATDFGTGTFSKFTADGILVGIYSSDGAGPAQLKHPHGIFVKAGIVYVCDTFNNRIQKFSALTGAHIGSFGDTSGPGQMLSPRNITLGDDNHFYITATGPIYKYSLGESFAGTWGTYQVDQTLVTDLNGPHGIYSDSSGVYVVDRGYMRVTKFDYAGAHVTTFGAFGGAPGYFDDPSGIASDELGNIYISEVGNQRIQKFNSLGVVQSR